MTKEYSNDDEDSEELTNYVVTLILRESGRVEVYSDFDYTFMFDLSSNDLLCVDINYDMNFFYMKYLDL